MILLRHIIHFDFPFYGEAKDTRPTVVFTSAAKLVLLRNVKPYTFSCWSYTCLIHKMYANALGSKLDF